MSLTEENKQEVNMTGKETETAAAVPVAATEAVPSVAAPAPSSIPSPSRLPLPSALRPPASPAKATENKTAAKTTATTATPVKKPATPLKKPAPTSTTPLRPPSSAPRTAAPSSAPRPVGKFATRAALLHEKAEKLIDAGVPFEQVYKLKDDGKTDQEEKKIAAPAPSATVAKAPVVRPQTAGPASAGKGNATARVIPSPAKPAAKATPVKAAAAPAVAAVARPSAATLGSLTARPAAAAPAAKKPLPVTSTPSPSKAIARPATAGPSKATAATATTTNNNTAIKSPPAAARVAAIRKPVEAVKKPLLAPKAAWEKKADSADASHPAKPTVAKAAAGPAKAAAKAAPAVAKAASPLVSVKSSPSIAPIKPTTSSSLVPTPSAGSSAAASAPPSNPTSATASPLFSSTAGEMIDLEEVHAPEPDMMTIMAAVAKSQHNTNNPPTPTNEATAAAAAEAAATSAPAPASAAHTHPSTGPSSSMPPPAPRSRTGSVADRPPTLSRQGSRTMGAGIAAKIAGLIDSANSSANNSRRGSVAEGFTREASKSDADLFTRGSMMMGAMAPRGSVGSLEEMMALPIPAPLSYPGLNESSAAAEAPKSATDMDAIRVAWAHEKLRSDCIDLYDWLQNTTHCQLNTFISKHKRNYSINHSAPKTASSTPVTLYDPNSAAATAAAAVANGEGNGAAPAATAGGDAMDPTMALFESLQTGVLLCLLAIACESGLSLKYNKQATPGSFQARDNIALFLQTCLSWGLRSSQLFETDDLVLRKNDRNVLNALLGIARCVYLKFGIEPPQLVKFELEIAELEKEEMEHSKGEEEMAVPEPPVREAVAESAAVEATETTRYLPRWLPYIPVAGDSLDEAVAQLVNAQGLDLYIKRISPGQYHIGDPKTSYVRQVRSLILVRVGGGWEGLQLCAMRKMGFEEQIMTIKTNA